VDIRTLNQVTVTDAYPMPLQSEVINAIRGARYISVVDAKGFFHQFLVSEDDQEKFTMVSPRGQETSLVALMGFKNSPAYVQRFMDKTLRAYAAFARAFMDDIVIYSRTLDDHVRHLKAILQLFQDARYIFNLDKSFIGYFSIELLR
jgi:hypothetical protein